MMKNIFSDELHARENELTAMGQRVSTQIDQAIKSYLTHDKPLAQGLIQQDSVINSDETDIEQKILTLLTLQQPVADDFRAMFSILKASSDLERIADHAASIAVETIHVKGSHRNQAIEEQIQRLSISVQEMLQRALTAYDKMDTQLANSIGNQDHELDQQFNTIRHLITTTMQTEPEVAHAGASYLLVAKLLERIGDRLVNLAEDVIYYQTGKIVELNQSRAHLDIDAPSEEK